MSLEAAARPSSADGILVPPSNGIDLRKLAKDTNDALEALEPFYTQQNTGWYIFFGKSTSNPMASKVKAYAKAIDSSIEASAHGYTIATDAIGAWNYILNTPEEKLDLEDKVLKAYLEKTSDLARKGLKLAEKARDDFQDVRKNLKKLIQAEGKNAEHTEATAAALEKFRDTLSLYVDWWVEMGMKHETQKERSDLQFNIIRHQGVLDCWKELQKDYVSYNKQIAAVRADHDHILKAN